MTKLHNRRDAARRSAIILEACESRVLFSGSPEPVTLLDEVVLPGDVSVGAAPFAQYDPYIASGPNGTSLAVWTDYRTGGHPSLHWGITNGTMADVWAARIAADGTLIDTIPIAINHDAWKQAVPKAAWNGSGWLISWSSQQNPSTDFVYAARLSAEGVVLDQDPILIMDDRFRDEFDNPVSPAGPLDVQPNGDGFVVTWWRTEPPPGGTGNPVKVFYGTRIQADGTIHPDDINGRKLHTGPYSSTNWLGLTYSPSNGGQFLQAFEYNGTIYTMRRAADLSAIDTTFTTKSGTGINHWQSEVVGSPDGWMIAYLSGSTAAAVRLNASNQYLDAAPLNVASTSGDPKLSAAFAGNGYVVTYSTNYNLIYGRRVPTNGAMTESSVLLSTLDNPAYALHAGGNDAGRYSVLFADSTGGTTDIAVVKVDEANAPSAVIDVSNAGRAHTAPRLASDGTNSLATFISFNQDEKAIKGVRLTPTGQPIEAEPFTIVPNSFNPGAPNVVFFGGRYVVIFKGDGPDGNILYGQQVSTDGQLIGTPVALTGGMGNGEASVLGNRLLISGLSNEGSLHSSYRFARIFDENLVALTDRINLTHGFTGGGQITTVGGRWLLAYQWKSSHNAPRSGIAYAFVNTDGTHVPPQTLVSSYPDNGAVTVISAGPDAPEAMIIWNRQDLPPELGGPFWFPNSNEGLIGQRMAADGTRIGELITLVDQPGVSTSPQAIFDGSNYVVTWVDSRNGQYPNQEVPDVFAARVAIDGTVLDPGGFPVAERQAPEDSVVAASGAGHTYFAYRSFRYEAPFASYRITTRLLDDVHAPATSSAPAFDRDLGDGVTAPRGPGLRATFGERLFNVDASDLLVQNVTTGQPITGLTFRERVGVGGRWEYHWIHNGALPNGQYTATLPAGSVRDKAGNPLASDVTFTFSFKAGDTDGNGVINFDDYARIDLGFNQGLAGFSNGDFNYDGVVNFDDYAIIDLAFNSQSRQVRAGGELPSGGAKRAR